MTYKETITWHEVKTRPLTDEEKDEHPTWGMIVEGAIPDEQRNSCCHKKRSVYRHLPV